MMAKLPLINGKFYAAGSQNLFGSSAGIEKLAEICSLMKYAFVLDREVEPRG